MLDSGARLRRDYSRYFEKHGAPIPEISQRPWLVGLTKEEALANPGSHLSSLFVYTPPRFHFSRSEQVAFASRFDGKNVRGLGGVVVHFSVDSQEALARDLRAGRGCRSRIAAAADRRCLHAASRGAERRRHLLNYLRQHPEELRPFESPQQQRRGIATE